MAGKITQVVWTKQAREALTAILNYSYKDLSSARKIVRKDIIGSSKRIVFDEQYQQDEVFQDYRRISFVIIKYSIKN